MTNRNIDDPRYVELRLMVYRLLDPKVRCRGCMWSDWRVLQVDHVFGKLPGRPDLREGGTLQEVLSVYAKLKRRLGAGKALALLRKLYQLLCVRCHRYKTMTDALHRSRAMIPARIRTRLLLPEDDPETARCLARWWARYRAGIVYKEEAAGQLKMPGEE